MTHTDDFSGNLSDYDTLESGSTISSSHLYGSGWLRSLNSVKTSVENFDDDQSCLVTITTNNSTERFIVGIQLGSTQGYLCLLHSSDMTIQSYSGSATYGWLASDTHSEDWGGGETYDFYIEIVDGDITAELRTTGTESVLADVTYSPGTPDTGGQPGFGMHCENIGTPASYLDDLEASDVGGTVNVTVTPSTVTTASAVQAPTTTADCLITPSTVTTVSAVQAPTTTADCLITPSTVTTASAVQAPTTTADCLITPSTIDGASAVQSVTIVGNCLVTPSTLTTASSVVDPTIVGNCLVTPSTLTTASSVVDPTVVGDCLITPSTLTTASAVQTPTIDSALAMFTKTFQKYNSIKTLSTRDHVFGVTKKTFTYKAKDID